MHSAERCKEGCGCFHVEHQVQRTAGRVLKGRGCDEAVDIRC
jgi:hypothetical protein